MTVVLTNSSTFTGQQWSTALTLTANPAFSAVLNSTISNASGDGTFVSPVIFNSEIFDQANNYNPATGVFTAPVDGKYHFNASVFWIGGTNMTQIEIQLFTSNRTIRNRFSQATSFTEFTALISQLVEMEAGDTASIRTYTTDSGGKVDDIYGTAGEYWTMFNGNLEC